jgi:hypothetical protein
MIYNIWKTEEFKGVTLENSSRKIDTYFSAPRRRGGPSPCSRRSRAGLDIPAVEEPPGSARTNASSSFLAFHYVRPGAVASVAVGVQVSEEIEHGGIFVIRVGSR